MDFPNFINWALSFPILGLLGGILYFYSNFDRTLCKQTVEILIRRRILGRLIWVCSVCLCPQNLDARLKWVSFEQSTIKLDCLLSNFVLMWFIYLAIKRVGLKAKERA